MEKSDAVGSDLRLRLIFAVQYMGSTSVYWLEHSRWRTAELALREADRQRQNHKGHYAYRAVERLVSDWTEIAPRASDPLGAVDLGGVE